MANGTSVLGRQVLDILPGTVSAAFVKVIPVGGLEVKYRGYIALEIIAADGSVYQIAGRSLWYEGVAVTVSAPLGVNSEVVGYWREAGVDWETAF